DSATRYWLLSGSRAGRVRRGCAGNPKWSSRRPAARPTAVARVGAPATASLASGLSPALLHHVPVPPHDRGGGDDAMPLTNGDSNRVKAANTARSAQDSRGLRTWRRNR